MQKSDKAITCRLDFIVVHGGIALKILAKLKNMIKPKKVKKPDAATIIEAARRIKDWTEPSLKSSSIADNVREERR